MVDSKISPSQSSRGIPASNSAAAALLPCQPDFYQHFSGIILSGGKSTRMGRDKAQLMLKEKTLLEWQIEKLHAVGITDILISGENIPFRSDCRIIPDILPDRGPLGGLHSCLQSALYSHCLVITVDTPLLPVSVLRKLCCSHKDGITVLGHKEREEPLIGVYDSNLSPVITTLIQEKGAPVRALKEFVQWSVFPYQGSEELLCNCNTFEEFQQICQYFDTFSKQEF